MIIIQNQKFEDLYNTVNPPDYLFGAIGDQIKFTVEFKVVAETVDVVMEVNGSLNTIRRGEGSFIADGFNFGDEIRLEVVGDPSSFRELKIIGITDTVLYVDADPGTSDDFAYHIHLLTEIQAVDLLFNLVANSSNSLDFRSYLDSSERKYSAGAPAVDGTVIMTPNMSSKAWQQGPAILTRLSNEGYHQRYRIEHIFLITPFYLEGQLSEANQLMVPDYFSDTESLKYIYEIRGRYALTDPDIKHTTDSEYSNAQFFLKPGNVGWFDEYLNARLPTYQLSFPTEYYEAGTTNTLAALSKKGSTDVRVLIEANPDMGSLLRSTAPYSAITVHLFRLPTERQYSDSTKEELANFSYARLRLQSDNVALGSVSEITPSIAAGAKAQIIDAGLLVEFTVLAGFYPAGTPYVIAVTVHDNAKVNATDSDRTAVIADINAAGSLFDGDGPFSAAIKFYWALSSFQPVDTQVFYGNIKSYVGDALHISSILSVSRDSEEESFVLKKAGVLLEASKSGFTTSYTLLTDIMDVQGANLPIVRGKSYKTTEPKKKTIALQRREDMDTADKIYYQLDYAQKIRWEEWRSLIGVQAAEPNALSDGKMETFGKHNWSQYNKKSWTPTWKVVSVVEVTDKETQEKSTIKKSVSAPVKMRQFDEMGITSENVGETLISGDVQTYDAEGYQYCLDNTLDVELASLNQMINAVGRNTRVVATFSPENANNFAGKGIDDVWCEIRLDSPAVGGENFIWTISSLELVLENAPLKSLDENGLIRKTLLAGPVIKAECVIDSSLLPRELTTYQLQARLGEVGIGTIDVLVIDSVVIYRTVDEGLDYKGKVTILGTGGLPPYEYSLNNSTYGSSPEFLFASESPAQPLYLRDSLGTIKQKIVNVLTKSRKIGTINSTSLNGITLAANGKFYCAPYSGNMQILEINPATGVTSYVGPVLSSDVEPFEGIVTHPNGKLYLCPRNAPKIVEFNPSTLTAVEVGSTLTGLLGYGSGIGRFSGAVVASNGKVYFAPNHSGCILVYNPATGLSTTLGSGLSSYRGMALGANGKIYCAPSGASRVLQINPADDSYSLIGDTFTGGGVKYLSVCPASDGKLYLPPCQAMQMIVIDPVAETASYIGPSWPTSETYAKFFGICQASNGRLYAGGYGKFACLEVVLSPFSWSEFAIPGSLNSGIAYNPVNKKLYTCSVTTAPLEIF